MKRAFTDPPPSVIEASQRFNAELGFVLPTREVLRAHGERVVVWGWAGDGKHILATRWKETSPGGPPLNGPTTLFRVPGRQCADLDRAVYGRAPRSVHSPDGRRIAFNAGFKRGEYWVIDNLFAK